MRLSGALVGLGIVVIAPAAHAAARPDLRAVAPSGLPAGAQPGSAFTGNDAVADKGRRKAAPSLTRWYLSADRRSGGGDIAVGSRKVGALKPGKTARGRFRASLPAVLAAGRWFVIACADD